MIFDPLLYWMININFSEVALKFLLHAKQQYSTNASLLDNDSNQVVGYIIQKRNDFFFGSLPIKIISHRWNIITDITIIFSSHHTIWISRQSQIFNLSIIGMVTFFLNLVQPLFQNSEIDFGPPRLMLRCGWLLLRTISLKFTVFKNKNECLVKL